MTNPHPEQLGRSAPDKNESGPADGSVPAIPQWVEDWGFIPLGTAFLVLLAMITDAGHAYGER
jgi:hypothetical protein